MAQSGMRYHVVLVYTVSKHATERGALIAMRRLQGSEDDIAMVVDMGEQDVSRDTGKSKSSVKRTKSAR